MFNTKKPVSGSPCRKACLTCLSHTCFSNLLLIFEELAGRLHHKGEGRESQAISKSLDFSLISKYINKSQNHTSFHSYLWNLWHNTTKLSAEKFWMKHDWLKWGSRPSQSHWTTVKFMDSISNFLEAISFLYAAWYQWDPSNEGKCFQDLVLFPLQTSNSEFRFWY